MHEHPRYEEKIVMTRTVSRPSVLGWSLESDHGITRYTRFGNSDTEENRHHEMYGCEKVAKKRTRQGEIGSQVVPVANLGTIPQT